MFIFIGFVYRVYISTSIFLIRLIELPRSPSPVMAMLFPLGATLTMVLSRVIPLDLKRMRCPTASCTMSRVRRCHCWVVGGSSWTMFILRFGWGRGYYNTDFVLSFSIYVESQRDYKYRGLHRSRGMSGTCYILKINSGAYLSINMLSIRNEYVIQIYKSYHFLYFFNNKHHYDLIKFHLRFSWLYFLLQIKSRLKKGITLNHLFYTI